MRELHPEADLLRSALRGGEGRPQKELDEAALLPYAVSNTRPNTRRNKPE